MKKTTVADRLEDATTVADAYQLFDQYVTPRDAGAKQREETERTFYAAADWALGALMSRSVLGVIEDQDGENAAKWIEARLEETIAFAVRDFARRVGS